MKNLNKVSLLGLALLLISVQTKGEFVSYIEGTIKNKKLILIGDNHLQNNEIDTIHGNILLHMVKKWANTKNNSSIILEIIKKKPQKIETNTLIRNSTIGTLKNLEKFSLKANHTFKNATITFADNRTILLGALRGFLSDVEKKLVENNFQVQNLQELNNFIQELKEKNFFFSYFKGLSKLMCTGWKNAFPGTTSAKQALKDIEKIISDINNYIDLNQLKINKPSFLILKKIKENLLKNKNYIEEFFKKYLKNLDDPFYEAICNCIQKNQSFTEIIELKKVCYELELHSADSGFFIEILKNLNNENYNQIVLIAGYCHIKNIKKYLLLLDLEITKTEESYDNATFDETKLHKLFETGIDQCKNCKKFETSAGKKFKRCARCKKAIYCSRECQLLDWQDRHEEECKNLSKKQ